MTEYVIKKVSQSLWMVFADRRSICACTDENEALTLMAEHSAANNFRSRNSADDNCAEQKTRRRENRRVDAPSIEAPLFHLGPV